MALLIPPESIGRAGRVVSDRNTERIKLKRSHDTDTVVFERTEDQDTRRG
jgi:hypothetical protein